jgi:pimeloyl-ACP methyl ester carboxylesterase
MKSAGNLTREDGVTIAYRRTPGRAPGVVFLGGFRSDMSGTKAIALEAHCRAAGRAYVRLDYRGHGESGGRFEDGTIGLWAGDAVAVLDAATEGPQILVGSSMGGWIMLLAALARPDRVAGLVGIAAAPDFTEDLIWARYPQAQRDTIMREGVYMQPSEYDPNGYPITRGLIEDGRKHLLLLAPIGLDRPVRLLHGMQDPDVPWQTALRIAERLKSDDVTVTLIKDGDHRLSREQDIARICAAVDGLA